MSSRAWYAVLAFSLVVASCAGQIGSSDPEGAGPADDIEEETGELAFAGDPVDSLETLRMALTRPETLDPQQLSLTDQSAVIVADLLYDGLTEVVGREGRLRGALATDWSADETLTRWTFTLDPARIDAATVVEHFIAPAADERSSSTAQLVASIGSVQQVDDETVVFELTAPNAGFAWLLSGLPASVIGPDGGYTGRFDVREDTDDRMTLVAEGEGGSIRPRSVDVQWTDDADHAYDVLTLGLADAAVAPVEDLTDASRRFGHDPVERSITVFYGLSMSEADTDQRREVTGAVDSSDVTNGVSMLGAAPTGGLFAPSLAGAEVMSGSPNDAAADRPTPGADGVGPALAVAHTDAVHGDVAEALAEQLRVAGFQATTTQRTPEEQAAAIAGGDAGLFAFGWVAPAGSLDAVVAPLLASDSPTNVLGYRSNEIDRLLAEAAITADDDARWELLAEAHHLALADARAVPLGTILSQLIVAPQAGGLLVRADGSLDLEPAR